MFENNPADPVAAAFEAQRGRLRAVAYRMLGSHADAEDVVQEAWLRLSRQDAETIANLAGWLTTVVGRISLDLLRSRRARPEASLDDRPPEYVVEPDERPGPDEAAVAADAVGLALLVVLESLRPDERLAFVLHDLFAVRFDEIGGILGRSPDAAKMLASRARKKVRSTGRPETAGPDRRRVVDAFLAAARQGDFEGLLRVLDPDVRLTAETPGGTVVTLGATRVAANARFGARADGSARAVLVNGLPGVLTRDADGAPRSLLAFTVTGGRITAITAIADPARLARIDLPGTP